MAETIKVPFEEETVFLGVPPFAMRPFQCFDTVGWASGRASSL